MATGTLTFGELTMTAGATEVHETTESTAVVLAQPFNMDAYLAGVANDGAIHAQQQLVIAYDRAVRALVGPNDVQVAQGKEFKKKSAWRKLARYFGISTQIVREEAHRDVEGHLVATVVVRAIAPWGQYAEAVAKCSTRESRFRNDTSKADHDCPATAQTRAANRAIADIIAAGEVTAEEIEFGEIPNHAPASPAQSTPRAAAAQPPAARPAAATGASDPHAPTDKQVAFYTKLAASPVFTAEEKERATTWLKTQATRQTIKDQIDWLKRQVETRKPGDTPVRVQAEAVRNDLDSFAEMPAHLEAEDDDLPF
jgi:hypothetical protein